MIPQKNPLIASGESVHANVLTQLWTNPDPSAAFGEQPITLSSSDYDFLLYEYVYAANGKKFTTIFPKGADGFLTGVVQASTTVLGNPMRTVTYNSATSITIGNCSYQNVVNGGTVSTGQNNSVLIPIAIYGFKKSLDITAIVSNVSTDATKCILSDNVTNVDDAIDGMTWKYLDSTTGNAEIDIPANATEVYARAFNSSTSFSFHFLTVENDIFVDRSGGYYDGATSYANMLWQWTKSTRKAKMYSFSLGGTNYTASTTTKWYYKTK